MARYQCAVCTLVRDSKESKKYVYASSTKDVKILVCAECHRTNIHKMEEASQNVLGKRVHLGILRTHPPKPLT